MAAPASLAVSKLFYPETQPSKTTIKDIKIEKGEESNVLDAAAKVVNFGICLIIGLGKILNINAYVQHKTRRKSLFRYQVEFVYWFQRNFLSEFEIDSEPFSNLMSWQGRHQDKESN